MKIAIFAKTMESMINDLADCESIITYMNDNQIPLTVRLKPWRNTILHKAAYAGHISLITYLKSLNFDFNVKDDLGQTALYVCKDLNTVKCIVECGGDINQVDDRGVTAICNYIEWGMTDVVSYLKELGVGENLNDWEIKE